MARIFASCYQLQDNFASGAHGIVFRAVHLTSRHIVAVKLENLAGPRHLHNEYEAYKILEGGVGVPRVYWFGTEPDCNALVMDFILGRSLEEYFKLHEGKFTMKTVLMLADQILARIEYVHGKDLIHGDIKPDNFIMGRKKQNSILFIVDFGLSKRFRDPKTKKHIPYSEANKISGTPLYASINNHMGIEQSRRDDLESLGYILMYFNRGKLPWQGFKGTTKKETYERIREKKMSVSPEELCQGFPPVFLEYFKYVGGLKFDDDPNYTHCRELFTNLLTELEIEFDHVYDWMTPQPNIPDPQAQQNARI